MKNKSDKIKILFMTGYFGVGGKERQMAEVIKNLPNNYEIYLMTKSSDAYYMEGIKHKLSGFINLNQKHFLLTNIFDVYRACTGIKPDVVYSWSDIFSHLSLIVNKILGSKFVLINGSIRDAPVKKALIHRIEAFLYRFYSVVVANSYAGLKAYSQSGYKNRFVMYNGVSFDRFPCIEKSAARERLGFPKDRFIAVMVANMVPRKDYETFIRVANEVHQQNEDVLFYAVGDGEDKNKVVELVSTLKAQNVVLLGKRSDVELIFTAADVSLLCSSYWHGEGVSNSILESLFCGVPVIATDSGGTNEVITNGVNGYIFDVKDYKNIAAKLIELKHDTIQYRSLSDAAVLARNKYNVANMIKEFEKIIFLSLNT